MWRDPVRWMTVMGFGAYACSIAARSLDWTRVAVYMGALGIGCLVISCLIALRRRW